MAVSADKRVENFKASRARVAAGLPSWALTIRFGPAYHDTGMAFADRRDAIVADVRASTWSTIASDPTELDEILKAMSRSKTMRAFTEYFNELFDMADTDRVWFDK